MLDPLYGSFKEKNIALATPIKFFWEKKSQQDAIGEDLNFQTNYHIYFLICGCVLLCNNQVLEKLTAAYILHFQRSMATNYGLPKLTHGKFLLPINLSEHPAQCDKIPFFENELECSFFV